MARVRAAPGTVVIAHVVVDGASRRLLSRHGSRCAGLLVDPVSEVFGIATHTGQQAGLEGVHPVQTEKQQSRYCGDAALLHRPAVGVGHVGVQPVVVVFVAGGPDDTRDSFAIDVDLLDLGQR